MEQADVTSLYGERFAQRGHPIWCDLPNVQTFDPPVSLATATERAGLTYTVDKAPLVAHWRGREMRETVSRGIYKGQPARFMLVREPARWDPEPHILGYCGADYVPLQNAQLAEILDPLTTGDNPWGMRYPVVAAGPLGKGGSVFYALDIGRHVVGVGDREPWHLYLALIDGKDARSSLRGLLVPVSERGWVSWVLGVGQSEMGLTIPHERFIRDPEEIRLALVAQARRSVEALTATMDFWADRGRVSERYRDRGLSPMEVRDAMLDAAHPLETGRRRSSAALDLDSLGRDLGEIPAGVRQTYDEARQRVESVKGRRELFRQAVMDRLGDYEDRHPGRADTPYSVMYAVAEVATWRSGLRADSAAEQALFGFRRDEMSRAFQKAVDLVGTSD